MIGIEENRFDPPAAATRPPLVANLSHALIHCFQRQDEIASKKLLFHRQGEEFLPQVSVLPHAQAVITHGGNNTTTECMWHGKPMLVLPIFWDQHDNAQRVHETGYGIRLPTYALERNELTGAVERLLTDGDLRARVRSAGERLRERPGTEAAADLIERVATSGEPAEIAVAG